MQESDVTETGIDRAIKAAKSQAKLAELLGVSQQQVSKYKAQGFVPLGRAKEIEAQLGIPRASLINPRIVDLVDGEGVEL